MTGVDDRVHEHDLETPDSIQVRFGITYLEADIAAATAEMTMQMCRYRNPFTGAPTVGPLAILVDAAAGIVNHYRRRPGQWTVSSELSMDLNLHDVGELAGPVLATAHAVGPAGGATSLGVCTLTYDGMVIGAGTVRSFYVDADVTVPDWPAETLDLSDETPIVDRMAAHVSDQDGHVLVQRVDPNLNNDIGIVHGGVAACGLELAASAAINEGRGSEPLHTASLRVNFLRPFFAGDQTRYEATPMWVGRSSGVGDAQAVGADGKVALTTRVTAYR